MKEIEHLQTIANLSVEEVLRDARIPKGTYAVKRSLLNKNPKDVTDVILPPNGYMISQSKFDEWVAIINDIIIDKNLEKIKKKKDIIKKIKTVKNPEVDGVWMFRFLADERIPKGTQLHLKSDITKNESDKGWVTIAPEEYLASKYKHSKWLSIVYDIISDIIIDNNMTKKN